MRWKSTGDARSSWATWFPAGGRPQSFIQGFPLQGLNVSRRGQSPFHFRIGDNWHRRRFLQGIFGGGRARDLLEPALPFHISRDAEQQRLDWFLANAALRRGFFRRRSRSMAGAFAGDPLGFGVQGHNCGYRHRNFWTWTHAYFPRSGQPASTLEALGLRDAFWTGLSQSGALARRTEVFVSEFAGNGGQPRKLAVEFSLRRAKWITAGSVDRRSRFECASSSLCEDRLHGQLRGGEQQSGVSIASHRKSGRSGSRD